MPVRLLATAIILFLLPGFTAEQQKTLAAACETSMEKAPKQKRMVPTEMVTHRKPICTCIAGKVSKDPKLDDGERKKILLVFQLSGAGSIRASRMAHAAFKRGTNTQLGEHTRACVKPYMK